MSANRVEKRTRPSKTDQRLKLTATIEEFGYDVMPCSFCHSRGLKCRMMERVSRCQECVRRGRSCDGAGVPLSSLSRVVAESQRLRQEEADTSEKLARLHRETSEALAKLERLRKQRESLVSRGATMVNRGLQSLDALDEMEREESEAVMAVQSFGGVDVIDWNAVFSEPLLSLPRTEQSVPSSSSS